MDTPDPKYKKLEEKGIAVPELAKFKKAKYEKGVDRIVTFLRWLRKEKVTITPADAPEIIDSIIYRFCGVDESKVKVDNEKILKAFGDTMFFMGSDDRAYPV